MTIAEYRESIRHLRPVRQSCQDISRILLAGEVAALGLDTRRRWYACTTGEHPAHCRCRTASANDRTPIPDPR